MASSNFGGRKLRIAFLNDLPISGPNTSGTGSGAELTSGRFIHEGTKRGHEIDAYTAEVWKNTTPQQYDLIVAKNVVNFNRDQLRAAQTLPYVAWPSDYAWTKWRLYFAFQPWHRTLPTIPWWREWFTKSQFNVFLSPLHYEAYKWVLPEVEHHPNHLSPPPGNYHLFKPNQDGWEPKTAATINGGLPFKGLHSNLTWFTQHADYKCWFLGHIRDGVNLPPHIKHDGPMSQVELAQRLGRIETYVELAESAQPHNQSLIQGFLSCKRVVTNKLVGAASWPWFKPGGQDACRQALKESIPNLWAVIEKEVQA